MPQKVLLESCVRSSQVLGSSQTPAANSPTVSKLKAGARPIQWSLSTHSVLGKEERWGTHVLGHVPSFCLRPMNRDCRGSRFSEPQGPEKGFSFHMNTTLSFACCSLVSTGMPLAWPTNRPQSMSGLGRTQLLGHCVAVTTTGWQDTTAKKSPSSQHPTSGE